MRLNQHRNSRYPLIDPVNPALFSKRLLSLLQLDTGIEFLLCGREWLFDLD